jgi:DNA invertase Pin-like site-specific DNA recombinase
LESARAHGYNVPEEYIFREEYTGASLERPELDKLRALAAVFALDLDRLARNTVFQKLIEEEFEHYKVPIQYATTLYDRTPEGAAQTGGLFLCRA